MKIQTTVTLYDQVELDIQLPYFCKFEDAYFLIEDEKKAVQVITREPYTSVCSAESWLYSEKIAKATAITEEEFNDVLKQAFLRITSPAKTMEVAA